MLAERVFLLTPKTKFITLMFLLLTLNKYLFAGNLYGEIYSKLCQTMAEIV